MQVTPPSPGDNPRQAYLVRYFQQYLERGERFPPAGREAVFARAAEASSLRKLLLDFREEGYTKIVSLIEEKTNALNRLQRLLDEWLPRLGPGDERHHFYLYPEPISLDFLAENGCAEGPVSPLADYLTHLEVQAEWPVDIAPYFPNAEHCQAWRDKTEILIGELLDFLAWIADQARGRPEWIPVTLLRDTLLVYFGLTWLARAGHLPRPPRPLFISRKFIRACPNSENTYPTLVTRVLYDILLRHQPCSLATLRAEYTEKARNHPDIAPEFVANSREYLDHLRLDGPPLVVETGLLGTLPLWIMTLTQNQGDFLLYSTAPWLTDTYRDHMYTANYNHLRDMETFVIHDRLFQFDRYHQGQVTVRETRDPAARALALYELATFTQRFHERFPPQGLAP